jgi:hypothetical protein
MRAEAFGHRVALAYLGNLGDKTFLDDPSRGRSGQDRPKWRAVDRGGGGVFRPAGDQDGAAVLHVAAHVVVIDRGQDAAALVAVPDDEVELLDLLEKQLPRREGDERQLGHRHAVLLVRRAEDGEVDEVDGGVGLQQVPPGPFARMRLARDEEDAQAVADAVDLDDGGVVAVGQLALGGRHDELDHVHAAVGKRDRKLQILVHRDHEVLRLAAVDGICRGAFPVCVRGTAP